MKKIKYITVSVFSITVIILFILSTMGIGYIIDICVTDIKKTGLKSVVEEIWYGEKYDERFSDGIIR